MESKILIDELDAESLGWPFVLVISLYGVANPYNVARFFEQADAIESKRQSTNVEPANWNVSLTRVASIIMTIASGLFVVLMLKAL